ncbi:unnamed protein product, partial [Allacma fusca]
MPFSSATNLAAHTESAHFEGNCSEGISAKEINFRKQKSKNSKKSKKRVQGSQIDKSNNLRVKPGEKKSTLKKGPFVCEVCLKKFEKRRNFDNHLLTHTNEKPFRCA